MRISRKSRWISARKSARVARSITSLAAERSSVGMAGFGLATALGFVLGTRSSSPAPAPTCFEPVTTRPGTLIITYGRKRQLLVAEPVYRFRPDKRVRPFVGLSIGIRIDQIAKRCGPISCEEVTAFFRQEVGTTRRSKFYSGGVISGLSLQPTRWLTLEAMLGVHDWPQENGRTTTEFAIMLGVVPWRSSHGP